MAGTDGSGLLSATGGAPSPSDRIQMRQGQLFINDHAAELKADGIGEAEDDNGRRFQLRKDYKNSLHEKAGLRKDLEAWRGRRFTDAELAGFDL